MKRCESAGIKDFMKQILCLRDSNTYVLIPDAYDIEFNQWSVKVSKG